MSPVGSTDCGGRKVNCCTSCKHPRTTIYDIPQDYGVMALDSIEEDIIVISQHCSVGVSTTVHNILVSIFQ